MEFDPIALLYIPVLLFSLSVHEWAHAWTAVKGGDDTPLHQGRLTLNPASHVDPIGTVIVPLLLWISGNPLFGWARPVQVNDRFLRKPVWFVWVAMAGPLSNVVIALVAVLGLKAALVLGGDATFELLVAADNGKAEGAGGALVGLAWVFIKLNVLLAVFNLLPIPPLDGSRLLYHYVVRGSSNDTIRVAWDFTNRFGFILLYIVLMAPGFRNVLGVLYGEPMQLIMRFLVP